MNYQYKCSKCSRTEIINKSVQDIDRPEKCGRCETDMTREICPVDHIKRGQGWGDK